jgi:hypothetical protein
MSARIGISGRRQVFPQSVGHSQRQIGSFTREVQQRGGRHGVDRHALYALPGDVARPRSAIIRTLKRQLLEAVARPRGIHEIAGNHRVQIEPREGKTCPRAKN